MIHFLQLQEFGLQLRIQQHASFLSLDLAYPSTSLPTWHAHLDLVYFR